jgi:AcrR family transcriptional regulator
MPRVSDAYRRARREEIALAALRALSRKGVTHTSMADIIEESGLSAGSIYSNFRDKSELAGYVARTLIGERLALVEQAVGERALRPREVLGVMLRHVSERGVPFPVVLQFWAEATADSELSGVIEGTVEQFRSSFRAAFAPWVAERGDPDPDALADRLVLGMMGVAQGYIARVALFGPLDADEYLDAVSGAMEGGAGSRPDR